MDGVFAQLDLYDTSRRFRDKIEKGEGCLEWSRKQFETLLIVCNEYSLIAWKIIFCAPDEATKNQALGIVGGLSLISQRYAASLAAINIQIAKDPKLPTDVTVVPKNDYRLLPTEESWEAMFGDRS